MRAPRASARRAPPALDRRQQFARRAPQARATSESRRAAREVGQPARRGRQRAPRREQRELVAHAPALADERLDPERRVARRAGTSAASEIGNGRQPARRFWQCSRRAGRATVAPRRWSRAASRMRSRDPSARRASVAGASLPTASASVRSVSLKPSNHARSMIRSSASASSPGRNVSRWPGEVSAVHRRHVERRQRLAATACRTSCRNGPRTVPARFIVRSAFAVRSMSWPAGM